MPRFRPKEVVLRALKKTFQTKNTANKKSSGKTIASAELKWELKEDYGIPDDQLARLSDDQLQQKIKEMQARRENALNLLKTKSQVHEEAARNMSYQEINHHLEEIKKAEASNTTSVPRYIIQKNKEVLLKDRPNSSRNHNPHPQNRKPVRLGETLKYQWAEISESTRLNEILLEDHINTNLIKDWSQSAKQQQGIILRNEIELVIGLDFGTTSTKVIIRDEARELAWAIPFNKETENRYLLKSGVYLDHDCYTLKGPSENLQSDLKTSLILGNLDHEKTPHLIAFLALVIRYSRNWFLDKHAREYRFNKFIWYHNLGMPSEIFNRNNLVIENHFKRLLCQSVMTANKSDNTITRTSISALMEENLCDKAEPFCKVIPEIQAQLIGHIESDAYDPGKRRFMIIDIGGGTADTAIVTLTDDTYEGNKTYNCMSSVVAPLGIEMLHKYRLDWIELSLKRSHVNNQSLIKQLEQSRSNFPLERYPGEVSVYLHNAIFPDTGNFSIDKLFYAAISDDLFDKPINKAKKLDPMTYRAREQPLQFFFCGGGSHHPLLTKLKNRITHNVTQAELPLPAGLKAPDLEPQNFHRLSVAFGLSFDSHGKFISADKIEIIPDSSATYGVQYIGPEQV